MFADGRSTPAAMLIEVAGWGVGTNRCQIAFGPQLTHPKIFVEAVIPDASQAANLPPSKTLTCRPPDINSLANSRMWVLVT